MLKHDEGLTLTCVQTIEQALVLVDELSKHEIIGFDIESNGKHFKDPEFETVGFSVAVDPYRAWYIPYGHKKPKQRGIFSIPTIQLAKKTVFDLFRFVWKTKKLVGHNLKSDAKAMLMEGEPIDYWQNSPTGGGIFYDTYVVQKVIDGSNKNAKLKDLIHKYAQRDATKINEIVGDDYTLFQYLSLDIAMGYAAPDASNAMYLYQLFENIIESSGPLKDGYRNILNEYELPLVKVTADMECRGIRISEKHVHANYELACKNIAPIQERLSSMVLERCPDFKAQYGVDFDPGQKLALKEAIFRVFSLENISGRMTEDTSKEVIEELLERIATRKNLADAGEFLETLLEWREHEKIRSTYTLNLLSLAVNGVLYPEMDQVGAGSGRYASRNPNSQNLPAHDEVYDVRDGFLPPQEDLVWVAPDYRAMEMHCIAGLSRCPVLCPILKGEVSIFDKKFFEEQGIRIVDSSKHYDQMVKKLLSDNIPEKQALEMAKFVDPHRFIGAKACVEAYDQVTKPQREKAKRVNFGIIYGITEVGLARQLKSSLKEAKTFIHMYKDTFHGVASYMDSNNRFIFKNGYISTIQGRPRFIPEWAVGRRQDAYASIFRWTTNHIVQGSCGYIMKKAMIKMDKEFNKQGLRAWLTFQIHDQPVAAVHKDDVIQAGNIMVQCMNTELNGVPIITDGFKAKPTLKKD